MSNSALASFGIDYFKILSKNDTGNIFYSPLSIFASLAMVLIGAKSKTSQQIVKAIHLDEIKESKDVNDSIVEMIDRCLTRNEQLLIANGLFTQKKFKLVEDFSNTLKSKYKAEIQKIDCSNSQEAANIINGWIEKHTNNKIQNMMNPSAISAATMIVLANAVYFKGVFEKEFNKKDTTKKLFHLDASKNIEVDMMLQSEQFDYVEKDGLRVLDIPFKFSPFSLVIGLPSKRFGLDAVINQLTGPNLIGLLSKMEKCEVSSLQLPRFKLNTQMDVTKTIPSLGITDLFDSKQCNLTGISGDPLHIDTILHNTMLDVNEEGVEAAAVTLTMMCGSCMQPQPKNNIKFVVDEPFLIAIVLKQRKTIVFLGKINKP